MEIVKIKNQIPILVQIKIPKANLIFEDWQKKLNKKEDRQKYAAENKYLTTTKVNKSKKEESTNKTRQIQSISMVCFEC